MLKDIRPATLSGLIGALKQICFKSFGINAKRFSFQLSLAASSIFFQLGYRSRLLKLQKDFRPTYRPLFIYGLTLF